MSNTGSDATVPSRQASTPPPRNSESDSWASSHQTPFGRPTLGPAKRMGSCPRAITSLGTEGAEVWPATAAVAGQAGNGAVEAFEGFVDYTRGVEINHHRDRRLWSYADIRKFAMPARNVFLASHRADDLDPHAEPLRELFGHDQGQLSELRAVQGDEAYLDLVRLPSLAC